MFGRLSMAVAALTAGSKRRRHTPSLWIFSDAQRLPDPTAIIANMRTSYGVVVRHTDSMLREQVLRKALVHRGSKRMKILVSQDWRLAVALHADGVHIPESQATFVPTGLRLWARSRRRMITTSAHSENKVRRAQNLRPDVVFVSPVFPTASHPERTALGAMRLARVCRSSRCAVGALGGVTESTLRALQHTHVSAVAGISFALGQN